MSHDAIPPTVQAHSAKLTQNPFVLRTPGLLGNVPERRAKPNCSLSEMYEEKDSMAALKLNGREQIAKRNLVPYLRATQSVKASFDIPRPEYGTSFSASLSVRQKRNPDETYEV